MRQRQVAKRGMAVCGILIVVGILLIVLSCTASLSGRIVRPVYPIQDAPAEAVMAINGQPAMHPGMLK